MDANENPDNAPASDAVQAASHDIPVPEHLREFIAQGWYPAPQMPHPADPEVASWAAKRRSTLSEQFMGTPVVIPAGAMKTRANDTDYAFRAASAFTWLTGETAAGAVLVLSPTATGHDATLYLPEYAQPGELGYYASRNGALWVGNVPTPRETQDVLQLSTRGISELGHELQTWRDRPVALLEGVDTNVDELLPQRVNTLAQVVDELRLVKDEWEIDRLRYACEATARGFADVVRELPMVLDRGGVRGERWLEGTFWRRARLEGNDVGYTSIVGAGDHATVLHWWRNHGDIHDGQLLLADMGIETDDLYTADVTRTLPVNGEWSAAQLRVYRAVKEAQAAGIDEVRAGNDFIAAHKAAMWVLADHLHSWGILPVTADVSCNPDVDAPGAGLHRRFTLHSTSHMLGIDVHDCAAARAENYQKGKLSPGHVLTVEPGLYFQRNDATVPNEFKGIGVRIEDDIVVTDGDPINLSALLPRDPDEIAAWMRDIQHSKAEI